MYDLILPCFNMIKWVKRNSNLVYLSSKLLLSYLLFFIFFFASCIGGAVRTLRPQYVAWWLCDTTPKGRDLDQHQLNGKIKRAPWKEARFLEPNVLGEGGTGAEVHLSSPPLKTTVKVTIKPEVIFLQIQQQRALLDSFIPLVPHPTLLILHIVSCLQMFD